LTSKMNSKVTKIFIFLLLFLSIICIINYREKNWFHC
jgi:hypothetical protein